MLISIDRGSLPETVNMPAVSRLVLDDAISSAFAMAALGKSGKPWCFDFRLFPVYSICYLVEN
jgi:hypothetical protein